MQFRLLNTRSTLILMTASALLLLTACGGGGGGGGGGGNPGVVGLSQHGSTNSHNDSRRGQDCMNCHSGSPGTGIFATSGTAISAAGGYVEYYSLAVGRTGMPSAKLEIDAYGNFYTVTPIDILTNVGGVSTGALVTIVMPDDTRRNMPGNVSHSSPPTCNSCHSASGSENPL